MDGFLAALTALGCGLNAGVFFAFSSFVMKALARLQPAQGIVAMQSINLMAVTPAFMAGLSFGSDRRPRWQRSLGKWRPQGRKANHQVEGLTEERDDDGREREDEGGNRHPKAGEGGSQGR
jgi:hypothetical protein